MVWRVYDGIDEIGISGMNSFCWFYAITKHGNLIVITEQTLFIHSFIVLELKKKQK